MDFLLSWGRESIVMIGVAAVPSIAVWATLVAIRSMRRTPAQAVISATIDVGLVVSLVAIAVVGLRPGPGIPGGFEQWNFVPFRDLARAIDGRPWGMAPALTGVIGNVVLFVPFGCFAALRFPSISAARLILATLALAIGIELMQAVLATGRASDLTDVITNTAGGAVGITVVRMLGRLAQMVD